MIRDPRRHRRGAALPESAVRPQEVVGSAHQPHSPLQRTALVHPGAGPTRQRRQPLSEGGVKALDVGRVLINATIER